MRIPHLHLPALCSNQVGRVFSRFHIVKLTTFLKPAHWTNSCQVIMCITNVSIISGACWNCWNVDVTVNEGVGAIRVEEFDMQGHPYLCDGDGGASVLLAVACFHMGEGLTSVCATIRALNRPIFMRLTVRAMATPLSLRSTCLCGQHAMQAWLIAGGGGSIVKL